MAEFEEKLNSILGNQEAMSQIMALARSLSGSDHEPNEADTPSQEAENDTPGSSCEVPDLSVLLRQVDPRMIQTGIDIMQQIQEAEDRNTALLNALRPFVKEDRRARLDQALELSRITKAVRVLLKTLREKGGGEHV